MDKKIANRTLQRGSSIPMRRSSSNFEEHVRAYEGTDRQPVLHPALTVTTAPVLHVPDEPDGAGRGWLAAVLDGRTLEDVLTEDDGVVRLAVGPLARLSSRPAWTRTAFRPVVLGYRRELWLWLAGERTWAQCCSGLIGRISRRVADDPTPRA